MHLRALAVLVLVGIAASVSPAQQRARELTLEPPRPDTVLTVRGRPTATADALRLVGVTAYDNAAFVVPWLDGRSTIEVALTHTAGLIGGGVMFGCRDADRAPPAFGQMVRFDTADELLVGTFRNGQFEADRRIRLPRPIAQGTRTVLRVDVDRTRRCGAIARDGAGVATDVPLAFPAGHVALQCSMGNVDFHRVVLRSEPLDAPELRWPLAFRIADDGFVVRARDGSTWHMPLDGTAARPSSADAPMRSRLAVPGARLDGGRVALANGHTFAGTAVGGIDAVDLRVAADGARYVLDQLGCRIVAVPEQGDDGPDELEFVGDRVRMRDGTPMRVVKAGDASGATTPVAALSPPLARSTRFTAFVPIGYRTWPTGPTERPIPFESPAPAGSMRVRHVILVVGLFGNVGETDAAAQALPALPDEGYARIERELRDTARWYFVHSGCRLWVDLRFVRRPAPVAVTALSSTGEANGEPPRTLLEALAAAADTPFGAVTGFVVAMDHRRIGADGESPRRVGRGGGLTLGAHGRSYGVSWWFVPGTPGYDGWLLCHEFHHQLDALFEIAGHPEYPFNHFAPSLHNVAAFGEHWDGNRWIVAGWPDHLWDALSSTAEVVVADVDGDHVPDADPRLPIDEDRFGSAPDRVDTDGDGLTDGEELALGRWLANSGFEVQLGPSPMPNPRDADADGDGVDDATDPLPLLPFDPVLSAGAWTDLGTVNDPRLAVKTSVRVRDGALELRAESATAATLQIQLLLDLDGDGWFQGRINARIHVRGDGARVDEVLDASSPTEWPTARDTLRTFLDVGVSRTDDAVTVAIRPAQGLEPGRAFALGIGYRAGPDRAHDPRWCTVFEPHHLVRFEIPK